MLISVDSAFNKFDRTLATTKARADRGLRAARPDALSTQATPAALVARFRLLRLSVVTAQSHSNPSPGDRHSSAPIADEVIGALRTLERAVGEIERTTKRALTHATFGLGPSTGTSGFGDPLVKSGFGAVLASLSAAELSSARSVVVLFALVGEALADLERAVALVEGTAVLVLAEQLEVGEVDFNLRLEVCRERIDSTFRILEAASITARRTLRRVLADPVYGLGPGLRGVGLEERQELADAGGLSSRNLVLL